MISRIHPSDHFNKHVNFLPTNLMRDRRDANMTSAHAEGITIINLAWEVPMLLSLWICQAIQPCLFLGKCGGIDRKQLGDLISAHCSYS